MNLQRPQELLRDLHDDDEGGPMAEYGIIAAGLAIPTMIGLALIIAAVSGVLSTTMNGLFNYMSQ